MTRMFPKARVLVRDPVIKATAAAVLLVSGCAPQMVWDKPGATQADYNRDSYACEKDMRQSGYYGSGLVGALNAQSFFNECMTAAGYTRRPATAPTAYQPGPRTEQELCTEHPNLCTGR
jgi:hypothetical protein